MFGKKNPGIGRARCQKPGHSVERSTAVKLPMASSSLSATTMLQRDRTPGRLTVSATISLPDINYQLSPGIIRW